MRQRLLATFATAALAVIGVFVGTAPAQASVVPSAKFDNGLCLDIPSSNAVGGVQVQQWGCNGTYAQWWALRWVDSTHFLVQSVLNPDLCLNDWEGHAAIGDTVRLYACNPDDQDSLWNYVYNNPRSGHEIQPKRATSVCLNMSGGDAPGNKAILWWCGKYSNETIAFVDG